MSERLITLSNVPGRQFTRQELLTFQEKGVYFTYGDMQAVSSWWNFLGQDSIYGVHSTSMELFNKLTQPEVAPEIKEEFVIPDKFTFKHKANRFVVYTATRLKTDEFEVSWEDNETHKAGANLFDSDAVQSFIGRGFWIEINPIVVSTGVQPTFEEVKFKLKEAQKSLVEAQQNVAQYEKLYKELVAAEEFGFIFSKKF